MFPMLVGQIIGLIIGGFIYAGFIKILLTYIFKLNPLYIPLSKALIVFTLVLYGLGFILGLTMGAANPVSSVITLVAFFVQPAVISMYVKTVENGDIGYGPALGAQIIALLIVFGIFFALIQFT